MATTGQRRAVRLALVALGLLLLLAVVSVASRGGLAHGGRSSVPGSRTYESYGLSALLVLMAAGAPFALFVLVVQQRERREAERKSFGRRVAENLLAFALVCLVVFAAWRLHFTHSLFRQQQHAPTDALQAVARTRDALTRHGVVAKPQPRFEWPVLWVALAVAAAGLAAFVRSRRHRLLAAQADAPTVGEELAASIGASIDDLEAEPDARRAVVAAYARMEAVLGRHGLARRASQTPLEYLRRVLGELSGRGEAAARLTALFEEARFSVHPVDVSMKRDAIEALRSIRDGLAA